MTAHNIQPSTVRLFEHPELFTSLQLFSDSNCNYPSNTSGNHTYHLTTYIQELFLYLLRHSNS